MKIHRLNLHCPACGERGIYQDADDAGDYYQGTACWCVMCHTTLPDMSSVESDRGELIKRRNSRYDAFSLTRYLEIRDAVGELEQLTGSCPYAKQTEEVRAIHAQAVEEDKQNQVLVDKQRAEMRARFSGRR